MKKFIALLSLVTILISSCNSNSSSNIVVDYHDDTIPGSDYHYEINVESKEIKMDNSHYTSTVDGETHKVTKTVKVDNDEVFNLIKQAYKEGIYDSDWIYVFCNDLEDIDSILNNEEVAKEGDSLWEIEYKEKDTNGDGIVTSLEDFKYTWGIMISELNTNDTLALSLVYFFKGFGNSTYILD